MSTVCGAVILGYIGITLGYSPYLHSEIKIVNKKMSDLERSLSIEEQQQFLKFYSQIVNMKGLLDTHVNAGNLLTFLEKNTNKYVTYNNLRFDVVHRELFISGATNSFTTLGEQLQAFEAAPEVENYLVQQARVVEGKVQFQLVATISQSILH